MILMAAFSVAKIHALELPVFALASGSYRSSLYPDREGRKLDWEGRYFYSMGIDSLHIEPFTLDLEVESEARLDGYHPVIQTFVLGWQNKGHLLELGTDGIGIGADYWFAQQNIAHYAYDGWLFEAARLNALSYTYSKPCFGARIALGGNQLSLATALAEVVQKSPKHEFNTGLRATVSDTHWRTPSLIASLGYKHNSRAVSIKTDLMAKEVFKEKDRPSRREYAAAGELCYQLSSSFRFMLGAVYELREFAPKKTAELNAGIHYQLRPLILHAVYQISSHDEALLQSAELKLSWPFYERCRIELGYRFNYGPYDEIRHDLLVQSVLRFDF